MKKIFPIQYKVLDNWLAIHRRLKLDPFLQHIQKLTHDELILECKTQEDNVDNTIEDIGMDKDFMTKTPKSVATKAIIDNRMELNERVSAQQNKLSTE